ncbi:MAG: MmgE/PrpD family protein [Hyphomonadaceae bacterium]
MTDTRADAAAATKALAQHALTYWDAPLDAEAIQVAKHCVLDWFAVATPGMEEPCAKIVLAELAEASHGSASIVGRPMKLAARDAALVNGVASHALDYDDFNANSGAHATAPTMPAVLAAAQEEGRSGMEALRAFIAGYEAQSVVGRMVAPSHYAIGFHNTATVGTIGAAVAAGLLLRLNEAQMRAAIGLAVTQASGLKSMFGTMAKPLHAGTAASNGVLAARLAKRGFTANLDALETPQGFIATQSREAPPAAPWLPRPGAEVLNNCFKYSAACFGTHSTLAAFADLREAAPFDAEDIESVTLHVSEGLLGVCNILDPQTGLESKFSLRQAAAFGILGADTADIATYSDRNARDPAIVKVREKVAIAPLAGTTFSGARVVVALRSGAVREAEADVTKPSTDYALQGRRLRAKYDALVTPLLGARAGALAEAIDSLETQPGIARLVQLTEHAT